MENIPRNPTEPAERAQENTRAVQSRIWKLETFFSARPKVLAAQPTDQASYAH
jgi:hypothetical protein